MRTETESVRAELEETRRQLELVRGAARRSEDELQTRLSELTSAHQAELGAERAAADARLQGASVQIAQLIKKEAAAAVVAAQEEIESRSNRDRAEAIERAREEMRRIAELEKEAAVQAVQQQLAAKAEKEKHAAVEALRFELAEQQSDALEMARQIGVAASSGSVETVTSQMHSCLLYTSPSPRDS
eukprot:TRINITY_DN9075_c0_g1_i1.p1 TRINITY_DN9075_c0_g1~~TRINITY_DN9075_c0_g1_i1.p1  ORF type:complete len:187 (+),score=68.55 TRINITY_DN9075_c0_g1_i1:162-722(+)